MEHNYIFIVSTFEVSDKTKLGQCINAVVSVNGN